MLKLNINNTGGIEGATSYGEFFGTSAKSAVSLEKKIKGQSLGQTAVEKEIPGCFATKQRFCSITVEGARTLNLGNYESAKIGVTLTVPCDSENIEAAYKWGTEWVSEKIEEAVNGVK